MQSNVFFCHEEEEILIIRIQQGADLTIIMQKIGLWRQCGQFLAIFDQRWSKRQVVFRLIRKKAKQELQLYQCVTLKYGMYNMIPSSPPAQVENEVKGSKGDQTYILNTSKQKQSRSHHRKKTTFGKRHMVIYKTIYCVGKVRRKDCLLFLLMTQVFCNTVSLVCN